MADRTREGLSSMHVSSGRWQFGLFLSLVTAVLWGILGDRRGRFQ